MLSISKPSENRVDINLSGSLDADAMREGLNDLVTASEGIEDGKMLYTISDFQFPTMGALAVEFQQMPKLFELIGKFKKCAVLSDTGWIRTAAEIEGAMLFSLEIRSFPLSATQEAERWLAGSQTGDDDEAAENFPL